MNTFPSKISLQMGHFKCSGFIFNFSWAFWSNFLLINCWPIIMKIKTGSCWETAKKSGQKNEILESCRWILFEMKLDFGFSDFAERFFWFCHLRFTRLELQLEGPRATVLEAYNWNNLLWYSKSFPLLNKVWLIGHDSSMIHFLIICVFLYGYLLKWSFVKTEVFSSRKILQKARWVTSSVWLIPY